MGTVSREKADPALAAYEGKALFHNLRPLPDGDREYAELTSRPPAPSVCKENPSMAYIKTNKTKPKSVYQPDAVPTSKSRNVNPRAFDVALFKVLVNCDKLNYQKNKSYLEVERGRVVKEINVVGSQIIWIPGSTIVHEAIIASPTFTTPHHRQKIFARKTYVSTQAPVFAAGTV